MIFYSLDFLSLVVDFRSRCSLFAGVPGSLLGAEAEATEKVCEI
jgi:hypothetical protein